MGFTVNQMAKYHQHLLERFHGVELAILATIREGKPGLCTTCWYKTSYYNCTDITPSNLARCRQQACPRCRYDERCTHDWCGPPTTTSTTTTPTTTITLTTTSVTTTDDTTTDNKDSNWQIIAHPVTSYPKGFEIRADKEQSNTRNLIE